MLTLNISEYSRVQYVTVTRMSQSGLWWTLVNSMEILTKYIRILDNCCTFLGSGALSNLWITCNTWTWIYRHKIKYKIRIFVFTHHHHLLQYLLNLLMPPYSPYLKLEHILQGFRIDLNPLIHSFTVLFGP